MKKLLAFIMICLLCSVRGFAMEATQEANNVITKGEAPDSDKVLVMILKPDTSPIEEYARSLTVSNFNDIVILAEITDAIDGEFNAQLAMPKGSTDGTYIIRVASDSGNSYFDFASFYYVSDQSNEEISQKFANATEADIQGLFEEYADVFADIDYSGCEGKYFILAKQLLANGYFGDKSEINYVSDVKRIAKAASCLGDIIKTGSVVRNLELNDDIKNAFGEIDTEEVDTVFSYVASNITIKDFDSFCKALQRTISLCKIWNGSYEDIANEIENSKEALGITTSFRSYTALSIARYIDSSSVESYAGGMDAAIKKAIEKLDSNSKSKSSGGGGGSSGGSSTLSQEAYDQGIGEIAKEAAGNKSQAIEFSDLDGFGWAQDAIYSLCEMNVLSGEGNSIFNPAGNITREQTAKIIVSAYGIEKNTNDDTMFADCDKTQWYHTYVQIAKEAGLVNGVSGDTFGVGQSITRQDFCVIIERAISVLGYSLEETKSITFTDEDEISTYAQEAVSLLASAGVISGYEDGRFMPQSSITRAEAAVVMNKVLALTKEKGE